MTTDPMPVCLYCGSDRPLHHHITGRDHEDRYFDPQLVSPLCHDHHQCEHDVLRILELDDVTRELSPVERIEWRIRRLAVHLQSVPMSAPLQARIVVALRSWADELAEADGGMPW